MKNVGDTVVFLTRKMFYLCIISPRNALDNFCRETEKENDRFQETKTRRFNSYLMTAFKGNVLNRALPSLHGG